MLKERLGDFLRSLFSICMMFAITGGVIVTVLFLAALILGGKTGEQLAIDTGKVYMPYFIRAAGIGVMAGLLTFYLDDSHELSLKTNKKTAAQPKYAEKF